jgi:hypothetical protein
VTLYGIAETGRNGEMERLTGMQWGALEALYFHDSTGLGAGWGGYGLRTFRSLAERGLADLWDRRATITSHGRKALSEKWAKEEA